MVRDTLSRLTDWLAARQEAHKQREHEKRILHERRQIEKLKYDLERSCYEIYAKHLKLCLLKNEKESFEREVNIDEDIQIRLRTFFNSKANHRQTVIRATSPKLSEFLEITFSHRAISQSKIWKPVTYST